MSARVPTRSRLVWMALAVASAGAPGCDDAPLFGPLPSGLPAPACSPAAERACFDGPADRADRGVCRSGVQRCAADGQGWGPCEGQVTPTLEDCGTEADEDCDGVSTCGQTIWSRRFDTSRDEVVADVQFDAAGDLLLTGYYRDAIDLGAGALPTSNTTRDVFVAKLSPAGNVLWSRGIYGDAHLTARGLALGPQGEVLVLASFAGAVTAQGAGGFTSAGGHDALLVMYDTDGAGLWGKAYGDGGEQHPMAAAFDPGGELWVTGLFTGEIDLGDGPLQAAGASYDGFVARLSTSGQAHASYLLPGSGDVVPRALAVSASGQVAVTGSFRGELDVGDEALTAAGSERDVFVWVLSPDGQLRWVNSWGDAALDRAFDVVFAGAGRIVVVGRFEASLPLDGLTLTADGGGAGFVLALQSHGQLAWARQIGGHTNAAAYGAAVDSRGRVVVAGYYQGGLSLGGTTLPVSGVAEPAILLTKLEPEGDFVYSRAIRVHGDQDASGILRAWRTVAVGPDDRLALGGYVAGPIDLGDGLTQGNAGVDAFAALLEP